MDQNAVVLVVDGPSSAPRTTPVLGGGVSTLGYRISAAGDAMVDIEVRSEDTGDAADRRRVQFAGSRDPERFARWLRGQFPGVQLVDEPSAGVHPSRDPTFVVVRGSIASAALKSSGGVPVFPGELDWRASSIPGGTRYGPLVMEVQPDLEWTLEVDLGRPPRDLPESTTIETRFGTLRLEVSDNDTGYTVKGSLRFVAGLVEAEDVSELREFLVAVERHLSRDLESP
jgi:hypothetical protein